MITKIQLQDFDTPEAYLKALAEYLSRVPVQAAENVHRNEKSHCSAMLVLFCQAIRDTGGEIRKALEQIENRKAH